MNRIGTIAKATATIGVLFMLTGCLTMTGGRRQRVRMEGFPEGTHVTVVDQENQVVYEGDVPKYVRLKRFVQISEAARYRLRFEHPDYVPRDILVDPKARRSMRLLNVTFFLPTVAVIYPYALPVPLLVDFFVGSSVALGPRRIQDIEMVPVAVAEANAEPSIEQESTLEPDAEGAAETGSMEVEN